VLEQSSARLHLLESVFGARLKTVYCEPQALQTLVRDADVVIGAVLVPGKLSPSLFSALMWQRCGADRPGRCRH
jgi:alanine dehydrogenase